MQSLIRTRSTVRRRQRSWRRYGSATRLGSVGTWLLNQTANLEGAAKEFQNRPRAGFVGQNVFIRWLCKPAVTNAGSSAVCDGRFSVAVFKPAPGKEIRAGVWVDDGAQVHKQARIVPPAYIGKNSRIGPASLITRSSSIERDCNVDYGTVIEDSTVLANTYIGTGLDVTHSVVCGNMLVHLNQNLVMEINDEILIGNNVTSRLREVFRRHEKKDLNIGSVKKDEHQTHWKGIL